MPKTKTFTVRGRGAFPFDMLRYDNCYPSDGPSAAAMERNSETRTVRLSTQSPNSPTEGRWASFMWHVQKDSSHG